ncbi:hypothetical protein, partial [uncultured Roseibium sp.]|uniref:T1SS-143 repeat domain-containing protein n=1 Tax=uncultured Roseibium sp. TaxID=1936171 RepID=UPI002629E1B8
AAVVGTVEEEGLTDGNEDTVDADGNDGDTDGGTDGELDIVGPAVSGNLQSLVSVGADDDPDIGADLAEFSLISDVAALQTAHNLTSAGAAVTYAVAGNATIGYTLTATAGSESVFTLLVNADGSYTFTLLGQIDHGTASDPATPSLEETLTLDFSSILRAEDGDGDVIGISDDRFEINIIDDVPVETFSNDDNNVVGTVEEEALT